MRPWGLSPLAKWTGMIRLLEQPGPSVHGACRPGWAGRVLVPAQLGCSFIHSFGHTVTSLGSKTSLPPVAYSLVEVLHTQSKREGQGKP